MTETPEPHTERPDRRPGMLLAMLGVFFVGLNLRPAITSVAFVIPDIQSDLALGATAAGMLTTVPLLAFVLLSMRAPGWGARWGLARMLLASLIILAIGFAIRMVPTATVLFIGMAVVGVAITIGNVLLPAFIKSRYPDRGGILMGVYTVSLYTGPALASALTLPIARATGSWRVALLAWGVLLIVALPLWLPQVLGAKVPSRVQKSAQGQSFAAIAGVPLAWAVTGYFAVLSVLFYTVNAWLPTMFIAQGKGASAGGVALTVVNLVAIPFALIVSILVHRTRSQVWATTIGSLGLGCGLAGLYFWPSGGLSGAGLAGAGGGLDGVMPYVFAALFGVGHGTATGIAFSLAMLRTKTVTGTAALGGLSQSAGYFCSALGPVGAGALHDLTGSWTPVMVVLLGIVVLQLIAGLFAGRDRYLEDYRAATSCERRAA